MGMPVQPGSTLSPREVEVIRAYARLGSQKKVAHELGISLQTVKNHMASIYARLGVDGGIIGALNALGYIQVRPDVGVVPCGWLAYCGRPEGHRGHHGGFRPFVRVEG